MIGLTDWLPDLTAMQVSSKCRAASAHAGRTQAPSHAISGLQDLQQPADGQEEQQPHSAQGTMCAMQWAWLGHLLTGRLSR